MTVARAKSCTSSATGASSSRWRLFRRASPELGRLAGEIAVGIRMVGDRARTFDQLFSEGSMGEAAAAPSVLPDPHRLGGCPSSFTATSRSMRRGLAFYRGSASRNEAILRDLATLTAAAPCGTPPTVAMPRPGDDGRSRRKLPANPRTPSPGDFESRSSVNSTPSTGSRRCKRAVTCTRVRPAEMFVCHPALTRVVATVFPPTYLRSRVGLKLPDSRLSDHALELIRSLTGCRRAGSMGDVGCTLPAWHDSHLGGHRSGHRLPQVARSLRRTRGRGPGSHQCPS